VPVWAPAGNTRRRSLAVSGAAIVLVGTLAAARAASRGAASRAAAGGVAAGSARTRASLANLAARTNAFFMNVLKPDQPYSPPECQSQFEITRCTPTQIQQALGSRAMLYLHKIYAESVRNQVTVAASSGDDGVTEPTSSGYHDYPETQHPATDPDVAA
jgi:hypothetical protein